MKPSIPYTKPSITKVEVDYATDAAMNGWGERCYDYIKRFEEMFKAHLGVKYAIATSSCTGALHIGLAALGLEFEDEVIVAETNWIATASPIVQMGAKPIFVDILPESWCLDPECVENAITPKTKAIIATHLYGNLCDMDRLMALSDKYGIPLIEDAAEAIGSIYHGVRAGSLGKFGVFSFHGSKTVTTGEGGIFVTNDSRLYEKALTLSNHGRSLRQKKQFWPEMIGFKYKMSNIQAAIGCGQLERIDELVLRKREILSDYRAAIHQIPGASINPEPPNVINGGWMPTVVFNREMGVTREMLQSAFSHENIDARVFFWPLSTLPMFDGVGVKFNALDISARAINLPSFHDMTLEEFNRVIQVLNNVAVSSVGKI